MKHLLLSLLLLVFLSATAQNNPAYEAVKKADKEYDRKNYQEALSILNDAIFVMPDSTVLYNKRAIYYESFRQPQKAIQDYSIALQLSEDSVLKSMFLSNRCVTKSKIRDFEGAYADCKQAVAYDSTNISALNNLATACDELGKIDESLEILKGVLKMEPDFIGSYINLGYRYQQLELHEKALEYFDVAAKMAPKEALVFSNRSFSLLKTGDLKGAMKDIEKSLKLYPNNSYAYKVKAMIQIEQNNLKDACENLFHANKLGYSEQYGEEVNDLMREHCN